MEQQLQCWTRKFYVYMHHYSQINAKSTNNGNKYGSKKQMVKINTSEQCLNALDIEQVWWRSHELIDADAESQVTHQLKHNQKFGRAQFLKVKLEDIPWLAFKYHLMCFISLHNVISMLCAFLNIDNRNYVSVKVYYFHRVRPPDIVFCFLFLYIQKLALGYA